MSSDAHLLRASRGVPRGLSCRSTSEDDREVVQRAGPIGAGGEVEVAELDNETRDRELIETFGLSEEIVARTPPDGEGFALG